MNKTLIKKAGELIKTSLNWFFGIFFALIGIISLFSDPIPGLLMLIMAAVLLPPAIKFMNQKWNLHLSVRIKTAVIIVSWIIFAATVSNTSKTPIAPTPQKTEIIKEEQHLQPETNKKEVPNDQKKDTKIPTPTKQEVPNTKTNENTLPEKTIEKPVPIQIKEPNIQNTAPTPSETVSQKNAIRKAKSYLWYSAFSYQWLIAQLEFEKFSHADAVYGADNCGANWNEQAAKKAKSYMKYSAFSRDGLIEQLRFEKFTQAQAEYGANAVWI